MIVFAKLFLESKQNRDTNMGKTHNIFYMGEYSQVGISAMFTQL